MKKSQMLPLGEETLDRNAESWLKIIKYRESGMVIQVQDDCEYYVPSVIEAPETLKRQLGMYYRKYLLGYVRLEEKDLFLNVKDEIGKLVVKRKIKTDQWVKKASLRELIKIIEKQGYELGLFISHVDKLIASKQFQAFYELDHLLRLSRVFSVVLFTTIDLTNPEFKLLADKCSSLYSNVIYYPLYKDKDVRQFINFKLNSWGLKLSERKIKKIVEDAGGVLWFASHILREMRNDSLKTIDQIVKSNTMMAKIEAFWSKLTEKEKEIVRKCFNRSLTELDRESHEYKYLKEIRLIVKVEGKEKACSPLFGLVIEKERKMVGFEIKGESLFYQELNLSLRLTPQEDRVLKRLVKSSGEIVDREEVARELWQDSWQEKYSDWAIDRLVYRLRSKLDSLNLDKRLLQTKKGKGLVLG